MLNGSYTAADAKKTTKMCFAAISVMAAAHLRGCPPQIAQTQLTEIAKRYDISYNTVKYHKNNHRKLDAGSRQEELLSAQRLGWEGRI